MCQRPWITQERKCWRIAFISDLKRLCACFESQINSRQLDLYYSESATRLFFQLFLNYTDLSAQLRILNFESDCFRYFELNWLFDLPNTGSMYSMLKFWRSSKDWESGELQINGASFVQFSKFLLYVSLILSWALYDLSDSSFFPLKIQFMSLTFIISIYGFHLFAIFWIRKSTNSNTFQLIFE